MSEVTYNPKALKQAAQRREEFLQRKITEHETALESLHGELHQILGVLVALGDLEVESGESE